MPVKPVHLHFARFAHVIAVHPLLPTEGNSHCFGYASPAQAAKAVPALTKTTVVALIYLLMTT